MRRYWIASALLSVPLVGATPAFAARAEMSQVGAKYPFDWQSVLWVTAAPGESNDIVVEQTVDGVRITDSTPVTAGAFCDARPDGSALCEADSLYPFRTLRIDAGDLDDLVRVGDLDHPVHVDLRWKFVVLAGGGGDDVLTQNRAAITQFAGGPGDDRMTGGIGIDRFVEDSVRNGSDVMVGGTEPDAPFDYFYRRDEVSYADRVNPIRADLEGDADDGEPGEGDQIGSDVESMAGGAGADILIGSGVGNWLAGGHGADRLLAGPGSDYVYGGGGNDSLYGGLGGDEIRGGSGRDRVRPGLGIDAIFGGPGNDVLRTRDGRGEDVECGGGWDRVLPDRDLDSVKDDCERDLSRPSRRR